MLVYFCRRTMSSLQRMKSLLRKELGDKINGLPEQEKTVQSAIIKNKVLSLDEFRNSDRISIFLSIKNEVDTIPILTTIFELKKQCFIPQFVGPDMIMIKLDSMETYSKLPTNEWGIKQPSDFNESEDALHTGGLDLMFMPGLAFTEQGARLGRGQGYYDKYLQKCKKFGLMPKTVALAFKEQVVDNIPIQNHDISVDTVIFPTQQDIDNFAQQ